MTHVTGVDTRDGNEGTGRATATTGDVDLAARNLLVERSQSVSNKVTWYGRAHVELRPTVRLGDVKSNLLNADEVLAAGQAPRHGERHAVDVAPGPGDALSTVGDGRDLVDLEPDGARTVPVLDVGARGCLSHVDVDHAGVVHLLVRPDSELGAGGDIDSLCGRPRLRSVAAEVDALHISDLRWLYE